MSYMLRFANEYPDKSILQQLVAKLPWGHNILLIEKVKSIETRLWYAQQCSENLKNSLLTIEEIENQLNAG